MQVHCLWLVILGTYVVPDAAVCHDASDIVSTGATLSWIPPSHINGKLKQYEVQHFYTYLYY